MLCMLGNTSQISRPGLYGVLYGPVRPIGPNVTDPYGIRMAMQSCMCPTFSHGLEKSSKKLGRTARHAVQLPTGSQGIGPYFARNFGHLEACKLPKSGHFRAFQVTI